MVKIGAFYPSGPDKKFDLHYYCEKFVPLLAELFGDALKGVTVDKGVYGGAPDEGPFFAAVGQYIFATQEEAVQSYFSNLDRIAAERRNFTDIEPIIQISEGIM
ncbi:MAG: EthD family reductase [Syntrophomonas sp.]|nr:EthD family reductase [Syntrophomonas sp.]